MIRDTCPATLCMRRVAAGAATLALLAAAAGCTSPLAARSGPWEFNAVEPASYVEPLPGPAPQVEAVAAHPPGGDAVPAEPLRVVTVRRLEDLRADQIRPLNVDALLHLALENHAVIRDDRQFLAASATLANPDLAASTFDSSIQATSAAGEAAALAAFDLQMASGAQWGQNALTRSNGFLTGSIPGADILVAESGSIYGRLDKALPSGGVASLVHAWNYVPNSLPAQAFNARYAGYLRTELRQPLWAGRGRDFTSVAGPISSINPSPGLGVAIARLNQDISVAEFESRIQILLKQTQDVYWDLWLAHQTYHSQMAALESAEELLRRVQGRSDVGLDGGEAANRAYAEENLYQWQGAVDNALANILEVENRLRRLTGLATSDGQLLMPETPPNLAQVVPDWDGALLTAHANRVELRQLALRTESLRLQCRAASNLAHPQLDVVAGAQLNGTGDELISGDAAATSALIDTDDAGWNVGFEFSMPLGFRLADARVRNLQLRLAKAQAALAAQRSEISHELAHVFHEIDRTYAGVGAAANRRDAARRRFAAVQADFDAGRTSLDLLLRTRVAVADAERTHAESIVAYNKSLIDLAYREGIVLRDNAITIIDAEGMK
jgi:outer membrane protein TolC